MRARLADEIADRQDMLDADFDFDLEDGTAAHREAAASINQDRHDFGLTTAVHEDSDDFGTPPLAPSPPRVRAPHISRVCWMGLTASDCLTASLTDAPCIRLFAEDDDDYADGEGPYWGGEGIETGPPPTARARAT